MSEADRAALSVMPLTFYPTSTSFNLVNAYGEIKSVSLYDFDVWADSDSRDVNKHPAIAKCDDIDGGYAFAYCAASVLQILAPELSDRSLKEFLDMESSQLVSFHIKAIDQTEAIKTIKHTITELDRTKIEEQKKAVRAGYDMDIIPSDLATYGAEAKQLLQNLQSRNERMFLVTFLIINTADTKRQLQNNIMQSHSIAQQMNCALVRLDFQQENALVSCLPLGMNRINIHRGLTTSSTAIFVPFTTQELYQRGPEALYVDKELVRASKLAIKTIGMDDIYHIFEPAMQDANTCLILKHPKTESSVRKVWLPKTVAYILRRWREAQTDTKEFLGDEYQDYNLVIAYNSGRPCDPRMIEKAFAKLKVSADLPNVVFHSLRHSSTTYKLKLNHGDLKATQGDTGHAEIDMITKVYAHILDEDRKINAQKFESSFYSNPDLREVRAPKDSSPSIDLNALIAQIQNSPELADALAAVIHRSRSAS